MMHLSVQIRVAHQSHSSQLSFFFACTSLLLFRSLMMVECDSSNRSIFLRETAKQEWISEQIRVEAGLSYLPIRVLILFSIHHLSCFCFVFDALDMFPYHHLCFTIIFHMFLVCQFLSILFEFEFELKSVRFKYG